VNVPAVGSTAATLEATVLPAGLNTWMKAFTPAPGAGDTVPVIDNATAPMGLVGLTDTETVAAAAIETIGKSARNAMSIPRAIVGSAFMWITEG